MRFPFRHNPLHPNPHQPPGPALVSGAGRLEGRLSVCRHLSSPTFSWQEKPLLQAPLAASMPVGRPESSGATAGHVRGAGPQAVCWPRAAAHPRWLGAGQGRQASLPKQALRDQVRRRSTREG